MTIPDIILIYIVLIGLGSILGNTMKHEDYD